MIYPPIGELLEKIGNEKEDGKTVPGTRYSLVIMASKRARELGNDEASGFGGDYDEAIIEAINEIYEGKIKPTPKINLDYKTDI